MLIDDSRSPLVFLRTHAQSDLSVEEQLQQLLDKGQRFVLVTDHSTHDHPDETPEERKQKARLVAATAAKAFGFAVAFASDEEDAIQKGRALLAQ